MSSEGKQALITILLAMLVSAALVGLAWLSMADLVLVPLGMLLGLAMGGYLGYRYGYHQAEQARQARRRKATAGQPRKRAR